MPLCFTIIVVTSVVSAALPVTRTVVPSGLSGGNWGVRNSPALSCV